MTQDPRFVKDIRYLTEQEEARERLKNSVDALTRQASLHVQMEKEPVKMLGGASAVGAVIGLVVGRQFRRTKKVYVDAGSPVKHQKALVKAQAKQSNSPVGALAATLATFAFKTVMDRVISPKLEEVANNMLEKAGQPQQGSGQGSSAAKPAFRAATATSAAGKDSASAIAAPTTVMPASTASNTDSPVPSYAAQSPTPAQSPASAAFDTRDRDSASYVKPTHRGVVPIPESHVEAKAVGTPIDEDHTTNPNAR